MLVVQVQDATYYNRCCVARAPLVWVSAGHKRTPFCAPLTGAVGWLITTVQSESRFQLSTSREVAR